MRHFLYVSLTILLAGAAASASGGKAGRTITIGPGAVLEDEATGAKLSIQLQASEFGGPGIGAVTMALSGGGLELCTIQGGAPLVLGQPVPETVCGTAGGMNVRIDKCRATIEAHGAAHADAPYAPYRGSVTIDIAYNRNAGASGAGLLEVTVHTPKRPIQLKGKITGTVTVPTCTF